MASKIHKVLNYNYSYDARIGGPGRLQLWGSEGKISDILFVGDSATAPPPYISQDLNSATAYFKQCELPDLISLLRVRRSVFVEISDQGFVTVYYTPGLADSIVECSTCDPDLLAAKTAGILEAMRRLINFCGADALPYVCPVTFHLDDDSYCAPYQSGATGYYSRDLQTGLGHVCTYDVEKENRSLAFTVENARLIQDQLLAVHEAMHVWFIGRQNHYKIQEPFCKLTSFIISEMPNGPEYCDWFRSTPDDHPDVLMKYLCEIGMTSQLAQQALNLLAQSAADKGSALSNHEFADIVTTVLGQDAVPAFQAAGILP